MVVDPKKRALQAQRAREARKGNSSPHRGGSEDPLASTAGQPVGRLAGAAARARSAMRTPQQSDFRKTPRAPTRGERGKANAAVGAGIAGAAVASEASRRSERPSGGGSRTASGGGGGRKSGGLMQAAASGTNVARHARAGRAASAGSTPTPRAKPTGPRASSAATPRAKPRTAPAKPRANPNRAVATPRAKPSGGGSFDSAFAAARKAGKKEFTWKGNRYNTKLAKS